MRIIRTSQVYPPPLQTGRYPTPSPHLLNVLRARYLQNDAPLPRPPYARTGTVAEKLGLVRINPLNGGGGGGGGDCSGYGYNTNSGSRQWDVSGSGRQVGRRGAPLTPAPSSGSKASRLDSSGAHAVSTDPELRDPDSVTSSTTSSTTSSPFRRGQDPKEISTRGLNNSDVDEYESSSPYLAGKDDSSSMTFVPRDESARLIPPQGASSSVYTTRRRQRRNPAADSGDTSSGPTPDAEGGLDKTGGECAVPDDRLSPIRDDSSSSRVSDPPGGTRPVEEARRRPAARPRRPVGPFHCPNSSAGGHLQWVAVDEPRLWPGGAWGAGRTPDGDGPGSPEPEGHRGWWGTATASADATGAVDPSQQTSNAAGTATRAVAPPSGGDSDSPAPARRGYTTAGLSDRTTLRSGHTVQSYGGPRSVAAAQESTGAESPSPSSPASRHQTAAASIDLVPGATFTTGNETRHAQLPGEQVAFDEPSHKPAEVAIPPHPVAPTTSEEEPAIQSVYYRDTGQDVAESDTERYTDGGATVLHDPTIKKRRGVGDIVQRILARGQRVREEGGEGADKEIAERETTAKGIRIQARPTTAKQPMTLYDPTRKAPDDLTAIRKAKRLNGLLALKYLVKSEHDLTETGTDRGHHGGRERMTFAQEVNMSRPRSRSRNNGRSSLGKGKFSGSLGNLSMWTGRKEDDNLDRALGIPKMSSGSWGTRPVRSSQGTTEDLEYGGEDSDFDLEGRLRSLSLGDAPGLAFSVAICDADVDGDDVDDDPRQRSLSMDDMLVNVPNPGDDVIRVNTAKTGNCSSRSSDSGVVVKVMDLTPEQEQFSHGDDGDNFPTRRPRSISMYNHKMASSNDVKDDVETRLRSASTGYGSDRSGRHAASDFNQSPTAGRSVPGSPDSIRRKLRLPSRFQTWSSKAMNPVFSESPLSFDLFPDKPPVAGFESRVRIQIENMELKSRFGSNALIANHNSSDPKVWIECRNPEGGLVTTDIREVDSQGQVTLTFTPLSFGPYQVALRIATGAGESQAPISKKELRVEGNNPTLSFNDGSFWPVAVAVDSSLHKRDFTLLYVAYSHQIVEFADDGRCLQHLTHLREGFYNDLVVIPESHILAASVSGWKGNAVHSYRYQEIALYHALSGRLLYRIGEGLALTLFDSPILHLAVKDRNRLIVADRESACEINIRTGTLETRLKLRDSGSISRVCHHGDHYYVTDASNGSVKIYDEHGMMEREFNVPDKWGNPVSCLEGLAVDNIGNILVSDSLTGTIWIFDPEGSIMRTLEAEWDPVRWPLDLSVARKTTGHVFIVDHGNKCIKKFKYLDLDSGQSESVI